MRYGVGPEVLRDISLHIEAGSFHFLNGASGAGKSSLLRLLYLAHRPSRGSIAMFGQDLANLPRQQLPPLRRRIGVVFQDFRLLDHLSVFENVLLPLSIAGMSGARARTNVGELLDWVGLGKRLDDMPQTLSGGEKQRVAIARAVISKPSLLLADEPTGNVDDQIGFRLIRLFEELHKSGTAVVVATHDESLVSRFAHPRLRLEDGTLIVEPHLPLASGA